MYSINIITHYFELYLSHILVAITSLIVGLSFNHYRQFRKDRRFRKFFGGKRNQEMIRIVYGQFGELINAEDINNPDFANAQKRYDIGKKQVVLLKRFSEFVGVLTIKSINYITGELSKHKKIPSRVCTDVEAVQNYQCSFISIGGPVANELTNSILEKENNVFFDFEIPENPSGNKLFKLYSLFDGEKKLLDRIDGFDYGVIIRLKNTHDHDYIKEGVHIVCAGLGSHGTSGACYYLANNWKLLYKEFGTAEFGILLKVKIGAPTDVSRITSKSN